MTSTARPDDSLPQTGVERANLAMRMAARDPDGLKGVILQARAGPLRDAVVATLPAQTVRIHAGIGLEALTGGLDLAQTLVEGRAILREGLLDRPGWLIISMAERLPREIVAVLCQRFDRKGTGPVLLLDEGQEPDDRIDAALVERVALHVSLPEDERLQNPHLSAVPSSPFRGARASHAAEDTATLAALACRFGVNSLRAPLFALRSAQAIAGLQERDNVQPGDLAQAAALSLAHRATCLPDSPVPPDAKDSPSPNTPDTSRPVDPATVSDSLPESILLEAVRAVLPPDLLSRLAGGKSAVKRCASGAGQRKTGNRRGRPLPAQRKRPSGRERLDIIATLRAAAPWQKIRRSAEATPGPRIWPSDLHVRRFEDRSDRLLIFAVDASGSAALARLAEAKGAVELLLSQSYATRDHVALIAFRGQAAELLLPPTRSLVQTRRRLAALPGGGGTPLAAALKIAGETALVAQRHGLSPALALLTDGRANVALDGSADRAAAQKDAQQMARWIYGLGLPGTVIDVGRRPRDQLAVLAALLGANYTPLPHAAAEGLSRVLHDSLA
jgi:magnesium chelatase subunit D